MKIKSLLFSGLFLSLINLAANAQIPDRTGWWKFDDAADLIKAEIGAPLQIIGSQQSVDGPAEGNLATQIGLGSYLIMTHGIGANGGGATVNDYSLQIDFSIPEASIWHAFFQTDPTNGGDADLFTNTVNTIGVGATGYTPKGITADTWYRMIITVSNNEHFRVYIDGSLWLDAAAQGVDGRYGLLSTLLLFADNDGDDGTIQCSELGIWDVPLEADHILALGGASGARVPVRTKLGLWKFDDAANLLKAEVGEPLQLVGSQLSVNGPEEGNKATRIDAGSYLNMTTGLPPNGGGTKVNEYSILIDFAVPATGIWHAFYQTDASNASDADLFANTDDLIGSDATTYSTNAISANTWYRMVLTVKNGEFYRVYINGDLWLDGAGQDVDGRFALDNNLLLFADNDGGDGRIICSEISIWEVALTDVEVADLGSDPTNRLPDRAGWWKFDEPTDLGKAEIGEDLVKVGSISAVNGPSGSNLAAEIGLGSYFEMTHGMFGNGDGTLVNDYTLQIDFSIPEAGKWHAFFQTDPLNMGDADLFTNTSNTIGTSATTYSSGTISAETWYRMVVTVRNGYFFKIYLDGELLLSSVGQAVDGRFALVEKLLLFADDDGDDNTIHCSEVGIWDFPMTEGQVAKLGDVYTVPTAIKPSRKADMNELGQSYPNPFAHSTTLNYNIQKPGTVKFHILDMTGRQVRVIQEGFKAAGDYSLQLKSENLPDGVYFVQMRSNGRTLTRKVVVKR